jgi:glycosyltransferase involved in cell wall biosynthesis
VPLESRNPKRRSQLHRLALAVLLMSRKIILFFDSGWDGHHPRMAALIFRHLRQSSEIQARFFVHSELNNRIRSYLDVDEASEFASSCQFFSRSRPKLSDVWKACNLQCAVHVIFLHVDDYLYALAITRKKLQVSALWFRPAFHYAHYGLGELSLYSTVIERTKRLCGFRLGRDRMVDRIYVHDSLAAEYMKEFTGSSKYCYIPDPYGDDASARIEPAKRNHLDRICLVICGCISNRKGIREIAEALTLLRSDIQSQLHLSVVGEIRAEEKNSILACLADVRLRTLVTVSLVNRIVTDDEIDTSLREANCALLLYTRFKGSSSILIRAAAMGCPVLATKEGFIGYLVKRHGLGACIGVNSIEIARALESLSDSRRIESFDPVQARSFAASSTPRGFLAQLAADLTRPRRLPPTL